MGESFCWFRVFLTGGLLMLSCTDRWCCDVRAGKLVACTQPRRVAAMSVAQVGFSCGSPLACVLKRLHACSSVCMRHTPFTRSPFPPCSVWRKRWMLTLGSTSVTPSVSRTARQRAPSSSAGGAGKRERRDGEKEKEKRKGGAWCGWTDGAGDSCPFSRLSSPTSLP